MSLAQRDTLAVRRESRETGTEWGREKHLFDACLGS